MPSCETPHGSAQAAAGPTLEAPHLQVAHVAAHRAAGQLVVLSAIATLLGCRAGCCGAAAAVRCNGASKGKRRGSVLQPRVANRSKLGIW